MHTRHTHSYYRTGAAVAALLAGALASALLVTTPAHAGVTVVAPDSQRAIMLVPNKSTVVRFDRPVSQALVGNADIADVVPMPGNAVYVLGKKAGTTSLTFYDTGKRLMAVIDLTVTPDAEALRREIDHSFPVETVNVRGSGDNLILSGSVSSAVAAQRIMAISETFAPGKLVNLMSIGSSQQVLLEVRFSEMHRSTVEQLGIRSLIADNAGHFSSGTGLTTQGNFGNFGSFQGNFNIGGLNIGLSLDALEQKGLITTLAKPNLMALSGSKASFLAGGEIPIPVAASASVGGQPVVTIQFKPFGTGLSFVPTVLDDGIINLAINSEVSQIDNSIAIRSQNIIIPGLKTRRAETTIELRDGESFAIAGLMQADRENGASQIPLLGSLPIIGALFRSTSYQRGETELVIVVTPHLVRPMKDATAIRLPSEGVRPTSPHDLILRGKVEQPGPEALNGKSAEIAAKTPKASPAPAMAAPAPMVAVAKPAAPVVAPAPPVAAASTVATAVAPSAVTVPAMSPPAAKPPIPTPAPAVATVVAPPAPVVTAVVAPVAKAEASPVAKPPVTVAVATVPTPPTAVPSATGNNAGQAPVKAVASPALSTAVVIAAVTTPAAGAPAVAPPVVASPAAPSATPVAKPATALAKAAAAAPTPTPAAPLAPMVAGATADPATPVTAAEKWVTEAAKASATPAATGAAPAAAPTASATPAAGAAPTASKGTGK